MGDKTGQERRARRRQRAESARAAASHEFTQSVKQRQAQWLRAFVREAFDDPPPHHDYGCGSGDVMRMLAGAVSRSHGYDASIAKLALARRHRTPGTLQLIDDDFEVPAPESPTLVTMFRLLLTASDNVVDRALTFAANMLPEPRSGLLVCENHGNSRSIRHLRTLTRRFGDAPRIPELSHKHMAALLDSYGFEILTLQGFSVLTRAFYTRIPAALRIPRIDDIAARPLACAGFASNVVYVARRRYT